MLKVEKIGDDFNITAIGRSPFVYLDTCALIKLAEDQILQQKFIKALKDKGGTLLISVANIIELGRKEGDSIHKLTALFQSVGEDWFPLEINPLSIIDREEMGESEQTRVIDKNFLISYYPYIHEKIHSLAVAIDLINEKRDQFDQSYSKAGEFAIKLLEARTHFQHKPSPCPEAYLVERYNPKVPTKYTYNGLMRAVLEGKFKFTANDVYDIWHASTSLVYADLVVLDGRWAQIARDKLKLLPGVDQKFFKVSELEQMIETLAGAEIMDQSETKMKEFHPKSRDWNKVTAIATVALALIGLGFGIFQYKILKTQTEISQSLRDHQIRANLEVSFSENYDQIWIQNVGELPATKIDFFIKLYGRGNDYAATGPSIDLQPNERMRLKIPKPKSIECKGSCEAVAMVLVLRYAWSNSPRVERIHNFFWVDGLNIWSKGQYL